MGVLYPGARGERVKLEREYLVLQQKALTAPGEALAEVRALREELFAVKREKATSQQKEAEVRDLGNGTEMWSHVINLGVLPYTLRG